MSETFDEETTSIDSCADEESLNYPTDAELIVAAKQRAKTLLRENLGNLVNNVPIPALDYRKSTCTPNYIGGTTCNFQAEDGTTAPPVVFPLWLHSQLTTFFSTSLISASMTIWFSNHYEHQRCL